MCEKSLEQRAAEAGWQRDPEGFYWHPLCNETYETLEEIPADKL